MLKGLSGFDYCLIVGAVAAAGFSVWIGITHYDKEDRLAELDVIRDK